MKASFKKQGINFLPAIHHQDGRHEVLWGDPLATPASARKYAQMEINNRQKRKEMEWEKLKKEHGIYCQVNDVDIPKTWEPTPGQPVKRIIKDEDLILSLDYTCLSLIAQVKTVFNAGTKYEHEVTDILKVAIWSNEEDEWKAIN